MAVDITMLAATLARMQGQIARLERNQRVSQLGGSSIDNGALVVNDSDGNQQVSIGLQPDGTFAQVYTAITVPATPDAPVLTPVPLGMQVSWDGLLSNGQAPLSDFAYMEAHISTQRVFTPSAATMCGQLTSAGSLTVSGLAADTAYFCCLVAVNVSGGSSAAGPVAVGIIPAVSTPELATWSIDPTIAQASYHGLNIIPDPQFSDASITALRMAAPTTGSWQLSSAAATATVTVSAAQQSLYLIAPGALWVNPGEQYYLAVSVTATGPCTVGIGIQSQSDDSDFEFEQYTFTAAGTQVISGVVTIPAGFGTQASVQMYALGQASGTPAATFSLPLCQSAQLFSPTIYGQDWVVNSSGMFFYSGTPGPGTLSLVVAPTFGADDWANGYGAGFTAQNQMYGTYASLLNGTIGLGVGIYPIIDITFNGLFFYYPFAASGSLIGSWALTAGTDQYGNPYPAGLNVGGTGQSITLVTQQNSAFNITQAIAGTLESVASLASGDASEVVAGILGSLLLGTGSATKQSTAIGSPTGTGASAYIVLESQNDGGTDVPVITFGTVTTPDNGTTLIYAPIMTITPYALLLYEGTSGTTTVTVSSPGSGTIPIPAGITTAKGESWGQGGTGARGGGGGSPTWGGGGAGGEYAREDTWTVPGGGTVSYVIPAIGSGSATTLTGSSVTVTAHAGGNGTTGPGSPAPGGTGSANSVHSDGGPGAAGGSGIQGGSGGGSSGGTSSAGNAGQLAGGLTGGAGGAAPAGGGRGGQGGTGTGTGLGGSSPGGGGGGGASGSSSGTAPGAAGQVRVTYSTGAPGILLSVASAAGTDQFGTSYPAGTSLAGVLTLANESAPSTPSGGATLYAGSGHAKYVGSDGNAYNTGGLHLFTTGTQSIVSTTPAPITGLSCQVGVGTYRVTGVIVLTQGTTAVSQDMGFSGPSTSLVSISNNWLVAVGFATTANMRRLSSLATGVSPAFTASTTYEWHFDGIITFTASGPFEAVAAESATGDTYTILAGSYMDIWPVS